MLQLSFVTFVAVHDSEQLQQKYNQNAWMN